METNGKNGEETETTYSNTRGIDVTQGLLRVSILDQRNNSNRMIDAKLYQLPTEDKLYERRRSKRVRCCCRRPGKDQKSVNCRIAIMLIVMVVVIICLLVKLKQIQNWIQDLHGTPANDFSDEEIDSTTVDSSHFTPTVSLASENSESDPLLEYSNTATKDQPWSVSTEFTISHTAQPERISSSDPFNKVMMTLVHSSLIDGEINVERVTTWSKNASTTGETSPKAVVEANNETMISTEAFQSSSSRLQHSYFTSPLTSTIDADTTIIAPQASTGEIGTEYFNVGSEALFTVSNAQHSPSPISPQETMANHQFMMTSERPTAEMTVFFYEASQSMPSKAQNFTNAISAVENGPEPRSTTTTKQPASAIPPDRATTFSNEVTQTLSTEFKAYHTNPIVTKLLSTVTAEQPIPTNGVKGTSTSSKEVIKTLSTELEGVHTTNANSILGNDPKLSPGTTTEQLTLSDEMNSEATFFKGAPDTTTPRTAVEIHRTTSSMSTMDNMIMTPLPTTAEQTTLSTSITRHNKTMFSKMGSKLVSRLKTSINWWVTVNFKDAYDLRHLLTTVTSKTDNGDTSYPLLDRLRAVYTCCNAFEIASTHDEKRQTFVKERYSLKYFKEVIKVYREEFKSAKIFTHVLAKYSEMMIYGAATTNRTAIIRQLVSFAKEVELDGLIMNYEPTENYTREHAQVYKIFLDDLHDLAQKNGISIGTVISSWGILKFYDIFAETKVDFLGSMGNTYYGRDLNKNQINVRSMLEVIQPERLEIGLGLMLDEGIVTNPKLDYHWDEEKLKAFLLWLSSQGITRLHIYPGRWFHHRRAKKYFIKSLSQF